MKRSHRSLSQCIKATSTLFDEDVVLDSYKSGNDKKTNNKPLPRRSPRNNHNNFKNKFEQNETNENIKPQFNKHTKVVHPGSLTANSKTNSRATSSSRIFFTLPLDKCLEFLHYDSFLSLTSTCWLLYNKSTRNSELKALGTLNARKWLSVDLQWDVNIQKCKEENRCFKRTMEKLSKLSGPNSKEWDVWENMSSEMLKIAGKLNHHYFKDWSIVQPNDDKPKVNTLLSQAVVWWNGYPRPELNNSETSLAVPRWAHHAWNLFLRLRFAEKKHLSHDHLHAQGMLHKNVPLASLLLVYTAAKLDGSIIEQRLDNLLSEFLPFHQLIEAPEAEETTTTKRSKSKNWTDSKVEVVRRMSATLNEILFNHSPLGFPSSSIVHDNNYFFLELFIPVFTKENEKQREIADLYYRTITTIRTSKKMIKVHDPVLSAIACGTIVMNIESENIPKGIKHLTGYCGREEELLSTIFDIQVLIGNISNIISNNEDKPRAAKKKKTAPVSNGKETFTSPKICNNRNRAITPLPPRKAPKI